MTTKTTLLESYHYPEQYEHFLANTKGHEMRVLHEDGLYRHLRFRTTGTGIWHFDLITWPGSLAIRGDIGEGFIFSRVPNMLAFFDHGQASGWINPSYWAEKLDRGSRSVRRFSDRKFIAWLREQNGADADMILAAQEEVGSVDMAVNFLNENEVPWDCDTPSSWEDYEYHFILALHAILWGAKKYHELRGRGETGE